MPFYFRLQRFYVATSRQLRRLESVSRSPIYSHLTESIQGAGTIRAFGKQQAFVTGAERKIDENQSCFFPSGVANRCVT